MEPNYWSRYSWTRNQQSRALMHYGLNQKYEVHATMGGFCLIALNTNDVWFLDARDESIALDLADPIIYGPSST